VEITIYHNPRCSKSRQSLALLEEHGIKPKVVEYLQNPPTHQQLDSILRGLDMQPRDLIYDSRLGSVQKMARLIARGVESTGNASAVIRCVPAVSAEPTTKEQPEYGDLFVELSDLEQCDGLIIGSPTRFGNMSASMKYFLDSTKLCFQC